MEMLSKGFSVNFNGEPVASFRYKGQVIVIDHCLSEPKIYFYKNANVPFGISECPEDDVTVVRNIEEAFRLIDAMPIDKPERLYGVSGNIDQISKSTILNCIDFVPVGPRQPNRAVAYLADIQKARDLYNFMRDNKMAVLRDWLD
jgi:hypothetical protein